MATYELYNIRDARVKTILFFSYKGGVGRSLLLCNTAAALCRENMRVGIVDFDVEAPSLHIQLANSLPNNFRNNDYTPDVLSLLRTDQDLLNPKAVREATVSLVLPWPKSCCALLPCFGREADLKAIETNWANRLPALSKIIEMLENEFELDFVLLDARTGYAQQALLAAYMADQVVAVTRADQVNLSGLKLMLKIFKMRPIEKTHLVITGVPPMISSGDPRLVNFVNEIGSVDDTIYFPYVPEWYFGGEVFWEQSERNHHLCQHFNALASGLIKNNAA